VDISSWHARFDVKQSYLIFGLVQLPIRRDFPHV
jgi:hypothetical protein